MCGLLSPNGTGKTTTFRMLSTVLTPDSGDVAMESYLVLREAHTLLLVYDPASATVDRVRLEGAIEGRGSH